MNNEALQQKKNCQKYLSCSRDLNFLINVRVLHGEFLFLNDISVNENKITFKSINIYKCFGSFSS